jgi:hypothetical protein
VTAALVVAVRVAPVLPSKVRLRLEEADKVLAHTLQDRWFFMAVAAVVELIRLLGLVII